jgi:hypothetical protein
MTIVVTQQAVSSSASSSSYLKIVNAVLRRLRENEVTSVQDTAYSKLIGDFVNETKREVEDAYDWSGLYGYLTITTVPGTNEYTMSGTTNRTRIEDSYNVTQKSPMCMTTKEYVNLNNISAAQNDSPNYWVMSGQDDLTGERKVTLYPTPASVETIRFYAFNPQPDLALDADVMKCPLQPVIDGAWARAISERGEDGGRMADAQFGIYKSTLADYISVAAERDGGIAWEPV